MSPEHSFEVIFGHCVYQATRLRSAVFALIGSGPGGFPEEEACYWFINEGQTALENSLDLVDGATDLVRKYASVPPKESLREALVQWEPIPDLMQSALAGLVMDALTHWHVMQFYFLMHGGKLEGHEPSPPEIEGRSAYDALLGLHCMLGGETLEQAEAHLEASTRELVLTLANKLREQGNERSKVRRPDEMAKFMTSIGSGLDRIGASAWRYHELIKSGRRFAVIDLESPMVGEPRHQLGELAKQWTQELSVASGVDRYRLLAQAVIGEAARVCAWTPPQIEPRRISLKPSGNPLVRRCVRIMAMVHELHKAGYQRVRMLPFLSPSGCYWRAWITFSDNVADDGYHLIDWDLEDAGDLVAKYSSGQDDEFFGWKDAKEKNARQLAQLFIARFPTIAERGRGLDWAYAGWLVDVIGHAEHYEDETGLIALIHDAPNDAGFLARWRPPPPLRY